MNDELQDLSSFVRMKEGDEGGDDFDFDLPLKLKNGARVVAHYGDKKIVEVNGEFLTL